MMGIEPTKCKYLLESVERILEQMACSNEEKLGCTVSLLNDEAHHWWSMVRMGAIPDLLT